MIRQTRREMWAANPREAEAPADQRLFARDAETHANADPWQAEGRSRAKSAGRKREAPADRRLFARGCEIRIRQARRQLRVGLGQSRPAIKDA